MVARTPLVFALSVPSPIAAALSSSIVSGRPRGRTPIEHPESRGWESRAKSSYEPRRHHALRFAWFNMARTHTRIYPAPVSTQQSGKNLKMFF